MARTMWRIGVDFLFTDEWLVGRSYIGRQSMTGPLRDPRAIETDKNSKAVTELLAA